jgi:hypothetical protein
MKGCKLLKENRWPGIESDIILIDCPRCIDYNNHPYTFAFYFHDIIPKLTKGIELNEEERQMRIDSNRNNCPYHTNQSKENVLSESHPHDFNSLIHYGISNIIITQNIDYNLDPIYHGIYELHLSNRPFLDIVFIHGLDGSADGTWRNSNKILWPKEWLYKDIEVPTRILSVGYENQTYEQISISS